MMEVVIVDDGNRLTVYELVERVIPCIIAKHYSENYIQGFRSTFRNLLAYCNKNEKKYFTAELAQQFMLDCYGVQPGTVERRCSRVHRAMDLLSDYQHFNAVMLRRRLNREFPAGLQEGAVNYLQKLSLHGRRENTLRSHRNVLLRFTDYLFSVGVTDYKLLSADIVNRLFENHRCQRRTHLAHDGSHQRRLGYRLPAHLAERPTGSVCQNHRRQAGFCQPVHGPLLSGRACHRAGAAH